MAEEDVYLFEKICCEHENLGVGAEALYCSKVPHALLVILGRGHDLEDMERRPRHVMPDHLQIHELQQGNGLDIYPQEASAVTRHNRLF